MILSQKKLSTTVLRCGGRDWAYRRVNNAKYPVSNLFSFLNSDQMMWYHAMHDNDSSPGAFVRYSYARYEDHYGFLYFFEDHEVASLVRKEYVVGENRVSSLFACHQLQTF